MSGPFKAAVALMIAAALIIIGLAAYVLTHLSGGIATVVVIALVIAAVVGLLMIMGAIFLLAKNALGKDRKS